MTFLAFDGTPVVPGFAGRLERHDDRVSVTVDDVPVDATLTVELGPDPQLAPNDVAGRLFTLLDRAQISYDLKTRIHQIATSDAPCRSARPTCSPSPWTRRWRPPSASSSWPAPDRRTEP